MANPFNPSPVTGDSIGKAIRDSRAAQTEPAIASQPKADTSFYDRLSSGNILEAGRELIGGSGEEVIRNQMASAPPKSLSERIGSDLIAIGAGIPIALAHPVETVKTILNPKTYIESVAQMFNPKYYEEHPGLATLNTGSNLTIVGGVVKNVLLKTATKAGINAALTEAAAHGIEGNIVTNALRTGKVPGFRNDILKNSVQEAAKSGNTAIVGEAVNAALVRGGVTPEVAASISAKVLEGVSANLTKNGAKLSLATKIESPFSTVGKALDPVKRAVFGTPTKTAVAVLYGADDVAKNPQAFLDIERWAGQQVEERGLKNDVANRQRVMQDWQQENPEWASLSPAERLVYHQNYVKADTFRKEIFDLTGDITVPGKGITKSVLDSVVESIKDAPGDLGARQLLDELEAVYGRTIGNWRKTIDTDLGENATREALLASVMKLGKPEALGFPNNKQAAAIAKKMEEESGYVPLRAPEKKVVSNVTDKPTAKSDLKLTEKDLVGSRTRLGALIDRLGLSGQGGVEGTVEYLYQDAFTARAAATLPKSFKVGWRRIPTENLYAYLERNRPTIANLKPGRVLKDAPYTLLDIGADDLVRLGFKEAEAKRVVGVLKKSLTDIPFAATGLAESVANMLKVRLPIYQSYLKTAYHLRFDKNPLYGFQQMIEDNVNKTLMSRTGEALSFGAVVDEKIFKALRKVTFLKDIVHPQSSLKEIKLVTDELLSGLSRTELEYAPELNRLMETGKKLAGNKQKAQFNQSIQSRNLFNRAVGYNSAQSATIFAKALAKKYGMSVDEALGYTYNKQGNKVYNNPEAYQLLKDSVQNIFHYTPGFLTSPLVRTLNVVWFPFRFQAKTAVNLAKFVSELSPASRMAVMNNWVHFADWATTPEGVEWRRENQNLWYKFINYVFPYESMGRSLDAAMRGKLFGGNTGMIGGMPFGFLVNMMTDLAILPEDPEQFSQATGRKFKKDVPKELFSNASTIKMMEDLVLHMMPSLPFYSLTAGAAPSYGGWVRDVMEGGFASVNPLLKGDTPKERKRSLERELKSVNLDETRF